MVGEGGILCPVSGTNAASAAEQDSSLKKGASTLLGCQGICSEFFMGGLE